MRQINFSIDDRAFARLEKIAWQHGHKATGYAKLLFEAAFASRVGAQVEPALDAQVAAAIVMHGAKTDALAIAQAVRLSESTVVQIIDAWRLERLVA